jgi:hypothetical protein
VTLKNRINNIRLKFVSSLQWLGKRFAAMNIWVKKITSEDTFSNASIMFLICSFFLTSLWLLNDEWHNPSDVSGAKLQAIATVFGNAFGVLGAVFSVLLILNRDSRNERKFIRDIKEAIGSSIIAKIGMVDLLYDRSMEISSDLNPKLIDFHNSFGEFTHITWNDLEALQDQFYKIDVLIPYTFSQLKLREKKVTEAFEKVINLPISYSNSLRTEAKLLHSCCKEYVQIVMLLSSRCEVEHEEWVYKKYPLQLN